MEDKCGETPGGYPVGDIVIKDWNSLTGQYSGEVQDQHGTVLGYITSASIDTNMPTRTITDMEGNRYTMTGVMSFELKFTMNLSALPGTPPKEEKIPEPVAEAMVVGRNIRI